jgi:hypothetical protein
MARQLLDDLRSGKDISLEGVHRVLRGIGGIEPAAAARVLMFQKALAACGADPEVTRVFTKPTNFFVVKKTPMCLHPPLAAKEKKLV